MLFLAQLGWGQLQFALEVPEGCFSSDIVDSTSTMTFVVINELSLPQQVSVSGIVAICDVERFLYHHRTTRLDCCVSFTPLDVSTYTDTIVMVGDVRFSSDTCP